MILKLFTVLLPWPVKRWALTRFFGFDIHPTAYIGFSWIFPHKLIMEENTRIEHLNTAIHLDRIWMKKNALIDRGNWITGHSTKIASKHFQHQTNRLAELILGESASVTKNHHLDCTNQISIGAFSTIAGYNSQFLTHSIDLLDNRQGSAPIRIGDYTFVGTNVVVLGGAELPARSVLGAKSLLNKPYTVEWTLYGGVPAKPLQEIPRAAAYFSRQEGFVI